LASKNDEVRAASASAAARRTRGVIAAHITAPAAGVAGPSHSCRPKGRTARHGRSSGPRAPPLTSSAPPDVGTSSVCTRAPTRRAPRGSVVERAQRTMRSSRMRLASHAELSGRDATGHHAGVRGNGRHGTSTKSNTAPTSRASKEGRCNCRQWGKRDCRSAPMLTPALSPSVSGPWRGYAPGGT
jgi:hypothetical protein